MNHPKLNASYQVEEPTVYIGLIKLDLIVSVTAEGTDQTVAMNRLICPYGVHRFSCNLVHIGCLLELFTFVQVDALRPSQQLSVISGRFLGAPKLSRG